MVTTKAKTLEGKEKPSKSWLAARLNALNSARQGNATSEALAYYVESLTGFSMQAIDMACRVIEAQAVKEFESRMPELGRLLELCRDSEQAMLNRTPVWSLQDYKLCMWAEAWFQEQMRDHGISLEEAVKRCPKAGKDVIPMWRVWRKERDAGTLICPMWCERCEGSGTLVVNARHEIYDVRYDEGQRFAMRCPACREARGAA